MPTTSRVTLSVLSKALVALWILYAAIGNVHACRPGRSLDLSFLNESADLTAGEALRLASWIADLKASFPNYEAFFIAGHVDSSEKGGKRLAEQRSATVSRFLVGSGFSADRVHLATAGTSFSRPIEGLASRSTSIDFIPACPNQCCTLPTHKAEELGEPMPGG
ncbi:OmpA family protein [Cupriavidus taiwanensis]|uniref:OmpA family protein n=1 Tax=Cupriavidus taiwanensis TaxID=164546 RepID=UPI000E109295|nr:OmpA family protein [Cupriavidus taiwanensis]SOZ87994.1 conserved exported hypothetical protein [Cupriavidus taiwanensis]SPD44450.1 conserved protein of unknown function [Cupriavidus taiwanensis]